MMERRQIVTLSERAAPEVLVTLVRAIGSSYRRPGARLLLAGPDGYAGTISGGCLEAEVIRKAAWLTRSGAILERYSTLFDDTANIPYGLGCGGVVDLLLEPAGTTECQALLAALNQSLSGSRFTVATWLPIEGRLLQRAIFSNDDTLTYASPSLSPAQIVSISHLEAGAPDDIFIEHILPPQRLFVLGAGDDAKPLVNMAAMLGWTVIVADGRAQLARPQRFPAAAKVIATGIADTLGITCEDAVVLMTHSYEQDRDLLAAILPLAPRYLGLLGARHRSSLLVRDASALTGLSVEQCCASLYAPVGLDLGGEGAESIALAVLAEVHACCQGKLGASRRLTADDIATQIALGSEARYLQAQCALGA